VLAGAAVCLLRHCPTVRTLRGAPGSADALASNRSWLMLGTSEKAMVKRPLRTTEPCLLTYLGPGLHAVVLRSRA
jgi:hypothetical protein